MVAFRLQLTNEFIAVTLARTDSAERDDLRVVCFGDVSNGNGLFMDIQSDVKRARLVHG